MGKKKNIHAEKKPESNPEHNVDTPGGSAPENRADTTMRIVAALLAVLVLACAVIFLPPFLNASPATPQQGTGSGALTIYYFYGTECPHCHTVTPYVESLRDKNPDINFRILETWHNETNNALFNLLNHRLGRDTSYVPAIIAGNTTLVGEDEIQAGLEKIILEQKGNLTGSKTLGAFPASGSAGTNATIAVIYFYGNGCSHCENVKPLIADLETRYPELSIEMFEINDNKTNLNDLLAMNRLYGVSGGSIPAIFVGKNVMFGEDEVRDHFEEYILAEKQRLATGTPAPLSGPLPTVSPLPPANGSVSFSAIYFYSDSCSHCEKVKPVIASVSARYPGLNLTQLEINHDADNRQLFNEMSSRYGIQNPGVPAIFIGNRVLIGEGDITNRFEPEILAEHQRVAAGIPSNLTPFNATSPPETPALSLYMVIFAALVDSTNPCGLSVLVFLLISMAAAGNRKRILLVGGVYIAAMFLFHLLVGIGLFSAFSLSGLSKPFSILGGIIALVLGIITLADVLRNRETYLLSIPESGKGLLGTYARKATLPAAFILGILAGILGFTCTGGIYISILGLMGRDMTVMNGLGWLILYNVIFVLPLVLVTLLVAYGISPARAERWRTENKRAIRVIIGVILVALGLVILSGWLG